MKEWEYEQGSLNGLSSAELGKLEWYNDQHVKQDCGVYRGIRVSIPGTEEHEITGIVTSRYKVVQHNEVFVPCVEAVRQADPTAQIRAGWARGGYAWLKILQQNEVYDSVKLGYKITNCHTGKNGISYSVLGTEKHTVTETVKKSQDCQDGKITHGGYLYVDVVGLRMVCQNGMKIKVPITEAMAGVEKGDKAYSIKESLKEIWQGEEERLKIATFLKNQKMIVHMGDVAHNLLYVQESFGVLAKLQPAIVNMIKRAENEQLSNSMINDWLKNTFGDRLSSSIRLHAWLETETVWGLVNQLTDFASHKADEKDAQRVQNKASELLVSLMRF